MFKKIEKPGTCEMQSVIRFFNARNMKPADTHAMSDSVVRRCVGHFTEGCEHVHDDLWSGRPSVVNKDLVGAMEEKIQEDNSPFHHFPCIFHKLQGHFLMILCLKNFVSGNCSHWVPKMLIDENKMKRQTNAVTSLTQYSEQGDDSLSLIVTGDKTWVLHVTPESKQQSMEWRHASLPIKKNLNRPFQLVRSMCTVFWDRKGVLLVKFLPQGSTVNARVPCDTLMKLCRPIQNK
jgi:hypothetical protein